MPNAIRRTTTKDRDELVSEPSSIRLFVELTEDEAWALALFLKRAGLTDYRRLARSEMEAYTMRDGAERIRDGLADAGVVPR